MSLSPTASEGQRAPTRYAGQKRPVAWAILLLLLALIGYGLLTGGGGRIADAPLAQEAGSGDAALYAGIAARVGAGEGYYSAVADAHRANDYPLRPFIAVRLPTLAWLTGLLGRGGASILHGLLLIAATGVFALRLRRTGISTPEWLGATVITAFGLALMAGATALWHESWAAALILLSLALRSPGRWIMSATLGLAACLFRELALPYLFLMAFFAWREGARREMLGWAAAIGIAAAALALHAFALSQVLRPGDGVSQGWASIGGWGFVLMLFHHTSALLALPAPATAVLLPLAMLGWSAVRDGLQERVFLLLAGYSFAFMLIGRPENFYWGLLVAPLLLPGLALLPRALRDLFRSAMGSG